MALRSQNGQARAGTQPVPARGQREGVGSRGGNVRSVQEARDLQAGVKDKRDWSGAIDEQIRRTLLETGFFHADDLDALCVPPEHSQLKGTRSAWFRNQGFMEKTGAERKVSHKAANGRKAAIHRITPKGRQVLTAGVSAGSPIRQSAVPELDSSSRLSASRDPGGARPTGDPGERSPDSATNPAVPFTSDQSSPVAESASQPAAGETLSLLPEPAPEVWAA